MGKFDGFLLVSDFDGTLINHDMTVSDENIQAIRDFIGEGGRFLGATGRTELNVIPYAKNLPMSSPWILYNGAAIYDWASRSFLYKAAVDRTLAEPFIRKVMKAYPEVNIQVFSGGPYCQINPGALPDVQAVRESQHYRNISINEAMDEWLKVLFCSDDADVIMGIEALLGNDPLNSRVHKMHSGSRYFELTAPGVTKGSALARLKQILSPVPQQVVAIGDYFNDIEMLQEADIPAAPESALPEVKCHARIITRSHTESAIADLVAQLEGWNTVSKREFLTNT